MVAFLLESTGDATDGRTVADTHRRSRLCPATRAGVRSRERFGHDKRGGTMPTKPIPEGYRTLSTYLAVDDAARAIESDEEAFGAQEGGRMDAPGGKIGHAELEIGDSRIMLSDPFPQAST